MSSRFHWLLGLSSCVSSVPVELSLDVVQVRSVSVSRFRSRRPVFGCPERAGFLFLSLGLHGCCGRQVDGAVPVHRITAFPWWKTEPVSLTPGLLCFYVDIAPRTAASRPGNLAVSPARNRPAAGAGVGALLHISSTVCVPPGTAAWSCFCSSRVIRCPE